MKVAFISDIHGNSLALEAVLEDMKKLDIDKVVVLGDICYRGINPKESLELVKKLETEVIRGNADEWVVRGVKKGEVPEEALDMMNQERDWCVSKLEQEDLDYLSNLPSDFSIKKNDIRIHAYHATPNDLFDVVQPSEDEVIFQEKLMKSSADIYIYAHIHKAFIRFVDGKCVINTGSVGLPFDGLDNASYVIIDINNQGYQTIIRRVSYNVSGVLKQIKESDYPNKALLLSLLEKASNK